MKLRFLIAGFLLLTLRGVSLYAEGSDSVIIQKAIDGETVEMSDGRRVHLIGVKTNHVQDILQERFKLSAEKIATLPTLQLASGAAEYINNQAVGKSAVLSYDPTYESRGHKDPEGRTLAYVWYAAHVQSRDEGEGETKVFGITTENHLLNQELIATGRALADTSGAFVQKATFLDSEQSAAKARYGFWRSAAELYQDSLSQAAEAQFSNAGNIVGKEEITSNLEVAFKTLSDLILQNPKDYRPYYERSWLGATGNFDKVTSANLDDAVRAAEISVFNPKCRMQKSYLLYLMGKYDEASQAYNEMLGIGSKLGLPSLITEMSHQKIEQNEIPNLPKDSKNAGLILDAVRATLNEDHFFLFMARYKSYEGKVPAEVQKVYDEIQSQGRFKHFYEKNEPLLAMAKPRELVYKIQWALRGHHEPEGVMRWMETIGDAIKVEEKDNKDVIDMTGRNDEQKSKDEPAVQLS